MPGWVGTLLQLASRRFDRPLPGQYCIWGCCGSKMRLGGWVRYEGGRWCILRQRCASGLGNSTQAAYAERYLVRPGLSINYIAGDHRD